MGRPKKSELRLKQINLRLTADEFEGICRRAEAVGMRPVHFSRAFLLADGKAIARKVDSHGTNMERLILGQLVRLGNNLNQLVRHLHRTGDPLPPDLMPLLTDIRQIVTRRLRP